MITGNRKPLLVHKYRYTLSPQPSLASGLGPARTLPVASAAAEEAQIPEPAAAGSPSLPPPLPDELRFSQPGGGTGRRWQKTSKQRDGDAGDVARQAP